MSEFDKQYISLCEKILKDGTRVQNRTGIDTIKIPFYVMEFDVEKEFPILVSKKVAWKSAILELLWFYQAQSNDVRWLQERGVKIWNEWEADENGYYKGSDGIEKKLGKKFAHTIGTAYGWIVNRFKLTQNLIETLKNKPTDRRMVLNLFQNQFMPTACLPSCVFCSEWDVTDGKLNLLVHCRSNDVPLGLPFNITQYAAFLKMIAHCTDLKPGKFLYTTKDAHIYVNQIEGIKQQIADYKQDGDKPAPKFWINPEVKDFFAFDNSRELKDFAMQDYEPQRVYSFLVAK